MPQNNQHYCRITYFSTWEFSFTLCSLVDLGIHTTLFCRFQRMSTWAGDLECTLAISWIWRLLRICPLPRGQYPYNIKQYKYKTRLTCKQLLALNICQEIWMWKWISLLKNNNIKLPIHANFDSFNKRGSLLCVDVK